ncbi:hypothetical protein, partial [Thermococcus sp. GR7]|uniref:hypothetical protein n=1 Tax=Thermococcus sp. GR7 TaxID=1638257 RepID=UPI00142F9C31
NIQPFEIDVSKFEGFLQNCFGTSYQEFGTTKKSHSAPSPFRLWGRRYLPTAYIPLDIDILISNNQNIPRVLVEIKRTDKIPVREWKPFNEDWRQYLVYLTLTREISMEFILINQEYKKNLSIRISDDTEIGWYLMKSVRPPSSNSSPYDYDREIITAKEARKRLIELLKS